MIWENLLESKTTEFNQINEVISHLESVNNKENVEIPLILVQRLVRE